MTTDKSPDQSTLIAVLEKELRQEIASAQKGVNGPASAYWLGARDAYRTVLTTILPTAKAEVINHAAE